MIRQFEQYTYRISWSEEDQEYLGLCVEFPSLSWLEGTPEKALQGIRQLVKDCVYDLEQEKQPVPEPIATKRCSGKFMVRLPSESHRKLALQAAEAGVSLNRWVASRLY